MKSYLLTKSSLRMRWWTTGTYLSALSQFFWTALDSENIKHHQSAAFLMTVNLTSFEFMARILLRRSKGGTRWPTVLNEVTNRCLQTLYWRLTKSLLSGPIFCMMTLNKCYSEKHRVFRNKIESPFNFAGKTSILRQPSNQRSKKRFFRSLSLMQSKW
jgi:hypothetical protein